MRVSSLVAQRLKRLPPMRETRVRSLGQEDPLEKEVVTHSSILAWRIPWTERPGGLQSMGSQRVGHDWATSLSLISSPSFFLFTFLWLTQLFWTVCSCLPSRSSHIETLSPHVEDIRR